MRNELTKFADDQLVTLFSEGCSAAFDTLIDRYDALLHTYIRISVSDAVVADDIFQDTFIKVINKVRGGQYAARGKFKPWLFRIAHNLVMDHFRRLKVQNIVSISEDGMREEFIERLPSGELNIEEQLCARNQRDEVRAWVARLPKEQRDVLLMRYLHEMSFKDIAAQTDVSINTALGRMRYALINLRKFQAGVTQV